MSGDEAGRLFSRSMRTRNRRIRDLLPDVEQLERYGLPVWRDELEVAGALGVSLGQIRTLASHRIAERTPHYVTFAVPKRSGGERLIMAPKRRLKALQRRLEEALVRGLPVSEHAHGFRRGRSIRTGAEPHVGRQVMLKLDLKDFFPSVTFGRVRGLLVALGYGYQVATTLALLMTESERQPVKLEDRTVYVPIGPRHCVQGAPTSPGMCNAIVLRLDRRLAGLARRFGFTYTRYADDLTFSGDDVGVVHKLRALATHIVREEGFEVNAAKTRVARQSARQRVTGVVVNQTLGLSRKDRRRVRAMIHQARRAMEAGASVDAEHMARIRGKLAYVRMLNRDQAEWLERGLRPEGR